MTRPLKLQRTPAMSRPMARSMSSKNSSSRCSSTSNFALLGDRRRTATPSRKARQGSVARWVPRAASAARHTSGMPSCATAQPEGSIALASRSNGPPRQVARITQRGRPRLPTPALRGHRPTGTAPAGIAASSAARRPRLLLRVAGRSADRRKARYKNTSAQFCSGS